MYRLPVRSATRARDTRTLSLWAIRFHHLGATCFVSCFCPRADYACGLFRIGARTTSVGCFSADNTGDVHCTRVLSCNDIGSSTRLRSNAEMVVSKIEIIVLNDILRSLELWNCWNCFISYNSQNTLINIKLFSPLYIVCV